MIQGTFTLSTEQDGSLTNLKLKVQGDNPEFMKWSSSVYCVESKLSGLSLSVDHSGTETFLVIRTPPS